MDAVVAEARTRSDFVILALPSLTSGTDLLALARQCHEIVLVVRERSVTRKQAATVREVLGSATAPALGIVLERRRRSRWSLRGRRHRSGSAALRRAPAPGREEAV
jgi:Mrp family chromosome partitioning ATPase